MKIKYLIVLRKLITSILIVVLSLFQGLTPAIVLAEGVTANSEEVQVSPMPEPNPVESLSPTPMPESSEIPTPTVSPSTELNAPPLTLTTDRADYLPSDQVVIEGSNFTPNTSYSLIITSNDSPEVNFETTITADSSGNFVYNYQLDGNYRPNYSVVLKDSSGTIVATTTFTDAPPAPASGVTVTCGSDTSTCGTNIPSNKAANGSQPAFTTLGNIIITENVKGDFPSPQTNATLILTAPTGWAFKGGTGSVAVSGTDITSINIAVTTSTIQITFTIAAAKGKNTMTISGIQVQATDKTNIPGTGNILRLSTNPGTAAVTGITNNVTNFGSLSQATVADATTSTVSSSPATVPADGSTTSTVSVNLKDSSSNAVSGKTVTLSSSRGSTDTISVASGVSDMNGLVTFTVKSSTVGAPVFTATDTTDNVVVTQTASVNFITSGTITLTPASGGTAINADTALGSWTSLTGPTIVEGSNGNITTGTIVFNIPTGFEFNTSTVTGTVSSLNGVNSCFTFSSNTATATSSTITFTVSAKDGTGGNPKAMCQVVFSGIQVRPTAGIPLASGNITNTGTSIGVPSGTNSYASLTEVAGTVSASSSTINASSSSVIVSGSNGSTITVTVKDSFGNPVSGKTVTLSGNNGTHSSISAASGSSASDGTVTFTVTDTTTESVTYTAVANGQTLMSTTSVTFVAGVVSASNSTVSANPTAIPADNMTPSTITVTLKDAFGNIIPSTAVSLSETQNLGVTITGSSATTNLSGQGTFTVKSANAGGAVFQAISGVTTISSTAQVTFTSVTQPTITAQLSSSAKASGWYNSSVDVTWTITDPSSIVTGTNNCGTTPITNDTASQTVTCEVTTSLPSTISSSVTIKLDKTKPTVTGSKSPTANVNGWNNTDVVVSFSCSDSGSGIDNNTLAGITLSSEGKNQSVTNTGTCIDLAGNTANSVTISAINIDKSSPSIASETPFGTLGNNGWYLSNVTVPFIATDNLSGFDLNNILTKNLASKTISSEGSSLTVLSDTVSDEASNSVSALTSDVFSIDKTAPTVASPSATTSVRNNKPNWTWGSSSDSGSGLETTPYTLEWSQDSSFLTGVSTATSATNSFTHTTTLTDGTWYFRVKAIDVAGNSSASGNSSITIDTTPVTTSSSSLSTLFSGGYFKSDATSSAALVDTTINVSVSGGTNSISLPAGTVITKTDGSNLDTNDLSAADVSASSLSGLGTGVTVDGALQWGIPGTGLTFSQPITLKIFVGTALNGQTLTVVKSNSTSSGWTSSGIVAPATCLVASGLCSFQATSASYYATTHTTSTNSPSNNGSSNLSAASPPICNDTKPGSAPTLLSAVAGTNSVTLTWSQAANPVTYYLVNYSLVSGQFQYGNPNVGGVGTTSYTVGGLSGGTTYYFKLRAGNNCAPGDYSNEISTTPGGGFIAGPAAGFAEGVLGAKTSASEYNQGQVEGSNTETSAAEPQAVTEAQVQSSGNFFSNLLNAILGFIGRLFGR